MNIYLLNSPFVEKFVKYKGTQGSAAQSWELVEQVHGNYIAFTDADHICLKDWFENLVCKFGNVFVCVVGGTKSIGKGLWKGAILLALDILLCQLDVKEMFIENDTFIIKKYQVTDFFNEHKREKLDPQWSCNARGNTLNLESIETMEKDDCTDSSPENLQTLGIISLLSHKTSALELEV